MTDNQMNREELEHNAAEELNRQEQQPQPYVERPKSQRVLAWILAGVVILGVILSYCWISGILK
jgi:hypothetical protein